jgi:hypothetical protein
MPWLPLRAMDTTTAALLGAAIGVIGTAIGIFGNALVTWINRHFDERKARRELMIKTAWDYYSSRLELAKDGKLRGPLPPFSNILFLVTRIVDLGLRENLSNQQIAEEMRKIDELEKELIKVAMGEPASN